MALCHSLILLLSSCSLAAHLQSYEYESVTFTLPQWPEELPRLQGWNISGNSGRDKNSPQKLTLPPGQKNFTLRLKKNEPFYVFASPMTQVQGFFKDAGTIYPYSKSLSWPAGYAARVMETLKSAAPQSYLLNFNWERFITSLEEKQQKAPGDFNPWLLEWQPLLESIALHNFTATKLNTSSTLSLQLELPLISSYVPQNAALKAGPPVQIILKKGSPNLFMLADGSCKKAVIICASSVKNLSIDLVSMPIFTEGI